MAADVTSTSFRSELVELKLGDANTSPTMVNMSSYIIENGVEMPSAWRAIDVTTYGSIGIRYTGGIDETKFTVDFVWNQVTTTGVQAIVGGMHKDKAKRLFYLFPAGSVTGSTNITGNCYCPDYHITGRVKDVVKARATFYVDNGVTFGVA